MTSILRQNRQNPKLVGLRRVAIGALLGLIAPGLASQDDAEHLCCDRHCGLANVQQVICS